MEPNYEARFERIEAALETMAKGMATLTTESHSAFGNINATQRHVLDLLKQQDFRFTALARATENLIEVQNLQGKNLERITVILAKLAEAQEKSELAQAKTQGKLDALIHMWDDWIRDRKSHRNGEPKNDPPKS